MLPRRVRLRTSEVKEILAHGKSVRGNGVSMKYIQDNTFRAAVIVPKSVVRGAVERNRFRRAAYRALRALHFPTLRAVFFIQKKPHTLSELRDSLQTLIR